MDVAVGQPRSPPGGSGRAAFKRAVESLTVLHALLAGPPAERPTKLASDVRVWLCDVNGAAVCPQWLSDEERQRMARSRGAHDQHLYAVAHTYLRQCLAACTGRPPATLQFSYSRRGRPELVAEDADDDLRFNMSHTEGLVAVVTVREADCGIDVERIPLRVDSALIARQVFGDAERRAFDERPRSFPSLWTRKEAMLKALGLEHPGILRDVVASPGEPAGWTIRDGAVGARHHLAVAIRRPREPVIAPA